MKGSKPFDYIIVGAGSAGCAVAARLSEDASCRVLLLEQGPPNSSWTVRIPGGLRENFKPNRPYMRWYPTVPQRHLDGRIINHPRGIGLGGSSLVNGMVFLRGNPRDYDRWESEGAQGWSYAEVLPYFKRMEHRAEGADAYRGGDGPVGVRRQEQLHVLNQAFLEAGRQAGYPFTEDVNGQEQEGFCRFDMNADRGYRSSSYFAFVERQPRKPNLEVRSRVTVLRILFEGHRAIGVEFEQEGQRLQARADQEAILSAGAIGSPQLLLLSGVGPADELRRLGIEPVQDLPGVGANLHDHLELDLQWECEQPITINGLLRPHKIAAIGLEWLLFRTGFAAGNQCHVGAFLRSSPGVGHPNIQLHFFPMCFDGWTPRRDQHGFRISAGPMRQTSRGTLKLRSADPRDLPILDPNYLATEQDRWEIRESFAIIRDLLSQKAFDPYRGAPLEPAVLPDSVEEIDALCRRLAATSFHLCGTCKMGSASDPMAVVDPQTRVRGLEGLRVADASIMPSIVSSNLNAPSMMIGERAAGLIRGNSSQAARAHNPAVS
ncbi:MAG TPA: choline dehydrogenase [Candidatus Udaeobacter sp.]|nr:choline dehydrogenase [Candidatus Udaeobacter sp.]